MSHPASPIYLDKRKGPARGGERARSRGFWGRVATDRDRGEGALPLRRGWLPFRGWGWRGWERARGAG